MVERTEQRRESDRRLPEICELQHNELNRRIAVVETSLQTELRDMYQKIDSQTLIWAERAAENAKRPGWATLAIITVLSSSTIGMLVSMASK